MTKRILSIIAAFMLTLYALPPPAQAADERWETFITVTNADTGEPAADVYVSHKTDAEFPLGHTTDQEGKIFAMLSEGKITLTLGGDQYTATEQTITVRATHLNEVAISVPPSRHKVKLPKIRTLDGRKVNGAKVLVQKTSQNPTNAWNDGDKALEADAESEQLLPNGEFTLTNSTYATTAVNAIYAVLTDSGAKYYADAQHTVLLQADALTIYVEESGDPMYRVKISREDETSTEYTATITLENIDATFGTFGLRYDPALFTFDPSTGITVNDELKLKFTPESMYGTDWSTENGYYVFVWQAGGDDATVFKTTGTAKTLATMKFTLRDASLAEDLTRTSFSVMPWHETKPAIAYEDNLTADGYDPLKYYSEYWRYCDEENEPESLTRGRLDKMKAYINGENTRGFYQASTNGSLGDRTNAYFYDIRTLIIYDYDLNENALVFHIIDADTGEDIEGATVRLYREHEAYLGLETSDYIGEATYDRDIAENTAYNYTVVKDGYWDVPETGYISEAPTITTEPYGGTRVTVPLQKKIYHVPEAADETIIVGGEAYGYNGRDYHFRIRPAPGCRITKYPTKATVSVGDETNIHLDVDPETELFTLSGEKLYQRALNTAEMADLGYGTDLPTPDEHGYRSYNIIVEFEDYAVEEIAYDVTAKTNAYGTVAYDPTDPYPDGLLAKTDKPHEKLIRTLKSTDTNGPNRRTGTFTFTANEGYKVEKVYINGLQIHTYDDADSFTYTFGEVDANNDITVLFYDGKNPSDDTVLTLVVGEYGFVTITEPDPENSITNTRRTYLNPDHDLVFTAEGMEGYELSSIEVDKDNTMYPETIYPDDPARYYRFEPPEKGTDKTIYVRFKNKLAENSPTLFVKSYVESGRGVIDPCGIQISGKGDTPSFTMTAQEEGDWHVKGVKVSPFNMEGGDTMYYSELKPQRVYIAEPLTEDTAIGAIFTEKGYILRGYVDLGQGSNITIAKPQSGATVTFTRTDERGNVIEGAAVYRVPTTRDRNNAVFTAELPPGTWRVSVSKSGYVRYDITNFTFTEPLSEKDITTFGEAEDGTVKKITPYIGSTRTGTSVSFIDLAAIMNTEREGVSEAERKAADVDDDGDVQIYDKIYALFNYGRRTTPQTYAEFLETTVDRPN